MRELQGIHSHEIVQIILSYFSQNLLALKRMLFRTVFASLSLGGVSLAKGAFVVRAKDLKKDSKEFDHGQNKRWTKHSF